MTEKDPGRAIAIVVAMFCILAAVVVFLALRHMR